MLEEYGLANIMRTGYADGGPSAAQEAAMKELADNEERLSALRSEFEDVQEFLASSRFLGDDMKDFLRRHYEYKVDDLEYEVGIGRLKLLGGWN